jgi:hypothetical protein
VTRRRTGPFGDSLVRLMDGATVVAVFHYQHDRWSEHGKQSKAEFRRTDELRRLPREERDRQATGRAGWRSHQVRLIGDDPFDQAYRREWDRLPVQEIPGYREVYDFGGGRVYRAERLYPALDVVRDAGEVAVQFATLNEIIRRLRPTDASY